MNILIVKLSSLGDVVQTMPVVADILTAHPAAQIDWVVEEAFAPLVARVQGVRHVIPIAQRRWRKQSVFGRNNASVCAERAAFQADLKTITYDTVIDCQGLIKSALVARMARLTSTGLRGSFANKSEACSYEWPVKWLLSNNQPMPTRIHAVARTRLLAAKLLGYEALTNVWQDLSRVAFKNLPVQNNVDVNVVIKKMMFTHGTTRQDNEWALLNWSQLAQEFIAQGFSIVLPQATDAELAFCEALAGTFPQHVMVLPRMNLSQLLDEMSICSGVIGVDSGLSHMAVALGLPHVQIFSQDRAWRAGPLPIAQGGVAHQIAIGGTFTPSANQVWQAWLKVSKTL